MDWLSDVGECSSSGDKFCSIHGGFRGSAEHCVVALHRQRRVEWIRETVIPEVIRRIASDLEPKATEVDGPTMIGMIRQWRLST